MGFANEAAKMQYPKIEISVKNYGRTPAFEIEHAVEIAYGSSFNRQPYKSITIEPLSKTIESMAIYNLTIRPDILVSKENWEDTIKGKINLWVYGYISFNNLLEKPYTFRFCRRYDVKTKRFTEVKEEL